MTCSYIGPVYDMRPTRLGRPVPVDHSRDAIVTQLLGGNLVAQVPVADRRQWRLNLNAATVDTWSWLLQLEQRGQAVRWWNPLAEHANLLPAAAADPGVETSTGWKPESNITISELGVMDVDSSGTLRYIAIPPDEDTDTFTFSAENISGTATISISGIDANGDPTSDSASIVGTAGTRVTTTLTVADPLTRQLALVVLGGQWSYLQLTATDGAVPWLPGVGHYRVLVTGVQEAYRLYVSESFSSVDWACTLVEVGGDLSD